MLDDLSEPIAAPPHAPAESPQSPGIDFQWIFRILLLRWKLITATPLIAICLTYSALKILPSTYKSNVELMIFDPRQHIQNDHEASPFDISPVGINTEIEVIKSKSLALRVSKELALDKDPEFYHDPGRGWLGWRSSEEKIDEGTGSGNSDALDRAADALLMHLEVSRVNVSYAAVLSITAQTPEKAQRLSATIADDYLEIEREARAEALARFENWLKPRIQELQSRVQASEAAIQKLKAESGMSDTGGKANVSEQQISDLNTQLMSARNEVANQGATLRQARLVLTSNGNVEEIAEVMRSTVIGQLHTQQLELNRREDVLQDRLGESHPEVLAIRAQLESVNKAVKAEAARVVGTMQHSYDSAVEREASLEQSLQDLTSQRGNSQAFLKLQQLERVADGDRKLYESYLSQANQLSVYQPVQDSSARIITPATLPIRPSSPRRVLFYGFGGFVGAGLGFMLAFGIEFFRTGIKTETEVERTFGYPVLGVIPFIQPGRSPPQIEAGWLVHRMIEAPLSEIGEALRRIRFRLNLELPLGGGRPKAVLLTSAIPGEGKSATAMLLAASCAAAGQRTAIVDCDLRHHSLSSLLAREHLGLADLLRGEANIDEVVAWVPAARVDLIPAGVDPSDAADLLTAERMDALVAQLRGRYDVVILDASPILTVVDGLVIARTADIVVLVAEWSRTSRESISEAIKVLRHDSNRVAGVVLNKADLRELRSYGYPYPALNHRTS
jgi:succinoglycan biosynthesis transport protein ExoP